MHIILDDQTSALAGLLLLAGFAALLVLAGLVVVAALELAGFVVVVAALFDLTGEGAFLAAVAFDVVEIFDTVVVVAAGFLAGLEVVATGLLAGFAPSTDFFAVTLADEDVFLGAALVVDFDFEEVSLEGAFFDAAEDCAVFAFVVLMDLVVEAVAGLLDLADLAAAEVEVEGARGFLVVEVAGFFFGTATSF